MKKLIFISTFVLFSFLSWSNSGNKALPEGGYTDANAPYASNPFEFITEKITEDITMDGISNIFPTPAKDYIIVDGIVEGSMEIVNLQGVVLKTVVLDYPICVIAISDLPVGNYFVRLMNGGDNNILRLFIE